MEIVNFFKILYNKYYYRPLLKRKLKSVGKNFKLGYSSELINPETFEIGDNFFCGPYSYFVTGKHHPVKIGNHVMFGPFCKIIGGNHDAAFNENHMYFDFREDPLRSKIEIEDGAWIGAETLILSKTIICEGVIIGAKSLVNSYIPPYVIAVGNPAKKFIKRFQNPNDLKILLQNIKSKYTFEEINEIYKKYNLSYLTDSSN